MLASFITAPGGPGARRPRRRPCSRAARPCGVILFARNVETPSQVRRLSDAARAAMGDDILVLIDQEGGRVRRLGRHTGARCRPPPPTAGSIARSREALRPARGWPPG